MFNPVAQLKVAAALWIKIAVLSHNYGPDWKHGIKLRTLPS
jgi:hypothetical protein